MRHAGRDEIGGNGTSRWLFEYRQAGTFKGSCGSRLAVVVPVISLQTPTVDHFADLRTNFFLTACF